VNVADFRARHPEFRPLTDDQITTALTDATGSIDPEVYGAKMERAIALKTADILARTPFGLSQRLVSDKGETYYANELKQLQREIAINMIVV